MDLPAIGAHCALESCHELDLLPIRCVCDKKFCRKHVTPDSHSCAALSSTASAAVVFEKLSRCAFEGCNKPSLESYMGSTTDSAAQREPAICSRCRQAFCASHRYPSSHACDVEEPPPLPKNEAAHALLQKHFPGTTDGTTPKRTSKATKVPTDPKKLEQYLKVQAMKMRHRAVPGDPKDKTSSVPVDQRLHVTVSLDAENDEGKVFWFRKSIGVGKALDCIAGQMGIRSSDATPRELCKAVLEERGYTLQTIPNDQDLSSQVVDGSKLVLRRKES